MWRKIIFINVNLKSDFFRSTIKNVSRDVFFFVSRNSKNVVWIILHFFHFYEIMLCYTILNLKKDWQINHSLTLYIIPKVNHWKSVGCFKIEEICKVFLVFGYKINSFFEGCKRSNFKTEMIGHQTVAL